MITGHHQLQPSHQSYRPHPSPSLRSFDGVNYCTPNVVGCDCSRKIRLDTGRRVGPKSADVTDLEVRFSDKSLADDIEPYNILTYEVELDARKFRVAKAGQYLLQFHVKDVAETNAIAIDVLPADAAN